MRLTQVWIQHYGPLQKELTLEKDINVIQGPNESGKSLLVEALLKKFVDDSIPTPRIDDRPDGFVELAVDGGVKQKLGDGETLTSFCLEHYNREVRPDELQSIFVVRNGDLSFKDTDFYSHITDKLTGRRVEDIDVVKKALFDAGRITKSRKDVSSDQKYDDAGNQLDDAKRLQEEIEGYIEKAQVEGLDRKESQFFAVKNEEKELEEKITELEEAREEAEKQEKFDRLNGDKETIEGNLQDLDDLPSSDDLEDIDDRLQTLSEEEGKEAELTEKKEHSISLAKWSIAAGVTGFAVSAVFGAAALGVIAALAFIGGAVYFWRQANNVSDEISALSTREKEILSDAGAVGLEFEEREEIRRTISDIEDKRADLQKENQGKKAVLERELGFSAASMKETAEKSKDMLQDLKDSIDESVDIEFDEVDAEEAEVAFENARESRERLEEEIEAHREKLRDFRDRAYQLDFNIFVGDRLDLEIENLDALNRLIDRLDEFISAIEWDAEAARVALEIFNDIQEEEREETAELFEEGSRATEIFCQITGDRYSRVTYDSEKNQLIVEKSTGETFVPDQLSDGTQDQLYLSIRVALGEQILDGNPGFFVMDDAFLTSDANRLSIQGEVVEKLADAGWQIIYLTSKQDAVDELSTRTKNDPIELPPLE